MAEIREGSIKFKEITEGLLKMEKPKYLTIDQFVELLGRFHHDVAIHMGGNYMNITRRNKVITEKNLPFRNKHILFSDLDNIYYSPGEYHPYLVMPAENNKNNKSNKDQRIVFKDTLSISPLDFSIMVIKYEDYELEDIDRRILNDIDEMERLRKSQL
jgi:hypothetical protein